MKITVLSDFTQVQVSDEDYDFVRRWDWRKHSKGYAIRTVEHTTDYICMHQVIAERAGLVGKVDHIDRNPSNNQRTNLRQASGSQNSINQGVSKRNTSGYKGVSFIKRKNKWDARITVRGKQICLGTHGSAIEAARAYDIAAKKHFGDFAVTNLE